MKGLSLILGLIFITSISYAGGSEGGWPTIYMIQKVGKVTSVGDCTWYNPVGSEHDPLWKCAQALTTSENGNSETIEVVFSDSNDIMWKDYPKLYGGETGTFDLTDMQPELPKHLVLLRFTQIP